MQLPNDITIRLASIGDTESILPLMIKFKEESSYSSLPTLEEEILLTIDHYINKINNIDTTVVIAISDSSVIGIIVGTASKLPFNRQIQAAETIWYVLPEYRNTEVGLALYQAFEYWAIYKVGAEVIHTASPTGSKLGKVFKKQGYKPLEEVYIKVL